MIGVKSHWMLVSFLRVFGRHSVTSVCPWSHTCIYSNKWEQINCDIIICCHVNQWRVEEKTMPLMTWLKYVNSVDNICELHLCFTQWPQLIGNTGASKQKEIFAVSFWSCLGMWHTVSDFTMSQNETEEFHSLLTIHDGSSNDSQQKSWHIYSHGQLWQIVYLLLYSL